MSGSFPAIERALSVIKTTRGISSISGNSEHSLSKAECSSPGAQSSQRDSGMFGGIATKAREKASAEMYFCERRRR